MGKYRIRVSTTSIVYAHVDVKAKSMAHAIELAKRKAFDHELEFLPAECNEVYDIDINMSPERIPLPPREGMNFGKKTAIQRNI